MFFFFLPIFSCFFNFFVITPGLTSLQVQARPALPTSLSLHVSRVQRRRKLSPAVHVHAFVRGSMCATLRATVAEGHPRNKYTQV
jgi:hypothetical protein